MFNWLRRKRHDIEGGQVEDSDMALIDINEYVNAISRRRFLKFLAVSALPFILPINVEAASYIIVIINSSDPKRKTLYSIITYYCDVKKFCAFYGQTDLNLAILKYSRTYLIIADPATIQNGTKIRIPRVFLKKNVTRSVKQEEKKNLHTRFLSPLGGYKRSLTHNCPEDRGVRARICPFDTFYARRSGGRIHLALDVYCQPGTQLYPIKPGIVTGSGYYVKKKNGRVVKFQYWQKNGYAIKIQTNDGFTYMYIHCLKKGLAKIGTYVNYDTRIAYSGTSGNATKYNPHVHISMRERGKLVDPLKYLPFLR
ncbi:MAG: M23 family metallopeptidase [Nanoarchaeota archaeon]